MGTTEPIIILGTGLAGYSTARELRKLDGALPLLLITADDGRYYSKPMLSNGYAQGKDADSLAINSAAQMADQLKARVVTHARVEAIDTGARQVLAGGTRYGYAKLVLALGADPIRLPLRGDAADRVLSVNDLGDYARFRAAAAGAQRVAILGAGLIGCEFANDLIGAGIAVDVIDIAPQPLGRLMPAHAADDLRAALEALGVRWHFGTGVERVDAEGAALRLTLTNGQTLDSDVVLSAIGLKPRTALAAAAGLTVNRGIVTDAQLATGAPDVYALGDCAEVAGLSLPFVMPIMHASRALARTLAGTPTAVSYPAMPVVVKTPARATVVAPPPAGRAGQWREEVIPDGVRALYESPEGRLLGFALTGAATKEKLALAKQLPAWLPAG
ncbi:MAG TPA: FAD-dependent oxidoreductase [Acidiferrobacterales bacterium]